MQAITTKSQLWSALAADAKKAAIRWQNEVRAGLPGAAEMAHKLWRDVARYEAKALEC